MTESRQKIVIDTDCGIDDAMAIMLALSDKSICEVVGITCCFGNCELDYVCKNVMRVLTVCGETKIPIYRGCQGPLIRASGPEGLAHGSDGLGNRGHEFPTGNLKESDAPAALALIQFGKKYQNELTLIALGPLTNLAMAHRIDPNFTSYFKQIVIMGGNYKGVGNTTDVAEFNFYCDPESAHIVLTETLCPVVLVPWETTVDHGMEWDYYKELIAKDTKKAHFFNCISEYRYNRSMKLGKAKFYDPDLLAVAAFMYPDCVKSVCMSPAVVECAGTYTRGMTVLLQKLKSNEGNERKKCSIITSLDDTFLNKLRKQILEF